MTDDKKSGERQAARNLRAALFRMRAADFLGAPPGIVRADANIAQALRALVESRSGAAAAVDADGRLAGILTEKDVAERVALRMRPDDPALNAMTRRVMTAGADDFLCEAIAKMRQNKLRHLPVVDSAGRLRGMLRLGAGLADAAEAEMREVEWLASARTIDGMRTAKANQAKLAANMAADSVPAAETLSLISGFNRELHRRAAALCMREMREAGEGDPPAAFALIVMGSGGRMESFLHPDQDNGIILDDYPDSEHARIDGWFLRFAERWTRALDAVGFPLCEGNVMASNPVWRKPLSWWKAQTLGWMEGRGRFASSQLNIFFDFSHADGARDLTAALRAHITARARNPHFLARQMTDARTRAGLGWFNRLKTESGPEHRGEVNVKKAGMMPLAESARLLALRRGVSEVSTLSRLRGLRDCGELKADFCDELEWAFEVFARILLRGQIASAEAGEIPGNYVRADSLSARERENLKRALKSAQKFRTHAEVQLFARMV